IAEVRAQADAAQATCEATGSAPAGYFLIGQGSLAPTNHAPVVDAGVDQTAGYPAAAVPLDASVVDDGFPAGTLAVTWSKLSGPGPVTFSAPASAATAATLSVPGVYTLRLTADDSQASTTDDVMVTLSAAPLPTLTIADVAVVEGQGDGVNAVLTVSLSAPSAEAVAFAYATGEGTASAECDYRRRYRAMTFPPGSTTRFVAVPIVGAVAPEAAETFPVHVGDVTGAVLGDGEAEVTILDDDAPDNPP